MFQTLQALRVRVESEELNFKQTFATDVFSIFFLCLSKVSLNKNLSTEKEEIFTFTLFIKCLMDSNNFG